MTRRATYRIFTLLGIIILIGFGELLLGAVLPSLFNLNTPPQDTGSNQLMIARVKLKNAQVVEGIIQDNLVLKRETVKQQVDSAVEYRTTYFLILGQSVVATDAEGVQTAPGYPHYHVVATKVGKAPVDNEVLGEAFESMKKSSFSTNIGPLKEEGILVVSLQFIPRREDVKGFPLAGKKSVAKLFYGERGVRTVNAAINQEEDMEKAFQVEAQNSGKPRIKWKCQVLGTVKLDEENIKMAPALKILTEKGVVTISLSQIEMAR